MMPDNQPRLFPDHLGTRHARVTIRIHEVNVSGDKNVPIIRASRRQNQRAEKRDLENDERKTSEALHRIDNRKSTIENRKLKWARQDSNLGPRDYESPALTAELQALLPMTTGLQYAHVRFSIDGMLTLSARLCILGHHETTKAASAFISSQ
jgi:hypothetical protein